MPESAFDICDARGCYQPDEQSTSNRPHKGPAPVLLGNISLKVIETSRWRCDGLLRASQYAPDLGEICVFRGTRNNEETDMRLADFGTWPRMPLHRIVETL